MYVEISTDPVWIEDKDGAEAEDEEGGGSVDHPNYCPRLKEMCVCI